MPQRKCNDCGVSWFAFDGRFKVCTPCLEERKEEEMRPVPPRFCQLCESDISHRYVTSIYCKRCSVKNKSTTKYIPRNDNEVSRRITRYAVKQGFLLHPSNFICNHCKRRQAECYDHRDYRTPLDVDAVCLPCNASLGKGIEFHLPKPTNRDEVA